MHLVTCTIMGPSPNFFVQVQDLQDMVEQQRYTRLLHLLQRSTIYSKFLLQRMETQNDEDKKKLEKKSKRKSSKVP